MPELPEIDLYVDALGRVLGGHGLERVRLRSPSLLKTYDPPLAVLAGKRVLGFRRLGKRIVWEMENDVFVVLHLMLTGRLQWRKVGVAIPRQGGLAAFDFDHGTLLLTERGKEKRASLHVVRGERALREHDPGGVEPLECDLAAFSDALVAGNRTLKRALTDPRVLAGIGNAYSDEILLRAKLSPARHTRRLSGDEIRRLWEATRSTLTEWRRRLREEAGERFPGRVSAFHPAMGAHGKAGEACPQCGTEIQRIAYASGETNYCPTCQTGGRLLSDRGLSRLLGPDWPRSPEQLAALRERYRMGDREAENEE